MPCYRLQLVLTTGHLLAKLFALREHGSEAFTLVSRCRSLAPFGPWPTDELVQSTARLWLGGPVTPEALARLLPVDHHAAPLIGTSSHTAPLVPPPLEDEIEFESLVLQRCRDYRTVVLERLDREELRELSDRWRARITGLESVPLDELM